MRTATAVLEPRALPLPQSRSSQIRYNPSASIPRTRTTSSSRGKTIALITSGEHYGSVVNGDFDYHKYLATIQADGLNFTRIFGGSYVEVPGKSFGIQRNDLAPTDGRFIAPWSRSATPGYAGGGNSSIHSMEFRVLPPLPQIPRKQAGADRSRTHALFRALRRGPMEFQPLQS